MCAGGTRGGGALGPLFAIQRTVVSSGLGLQRTVADRLVERIEDAADASRRRRLAAHYAAVQAVDRIEDAHPDEEASLDALYDGVGRTFDVAASLDERTHEFTTSTVENGVGLSETTSEAYLQATEKGCRATGGPARAEEIDGSG